MNIPMWIAFLAPRERWERVVDAIKEDKFCRFTAGGRAYDEYENFFKVPRTDEETVLHCFGDHPKAMETMEIVKKTLGRVPKVFYHAFFASKYNVLSDNEIKSAANIISIFCNRINVKKFVKIGKGVLEEGNYDASTKFMVAACIFGNKIDLVNICDFHFTNICWSITRHQDGEKLERILKVIDLLQFKTLDDLNCIFKLSEIIDNDRTDPISMSEAREMIRKNAMDYFDVIEECNNNQTLANAIKTGMAGGQTKTMEKISELSHEIGKYSIRLLDKSDPTGMLLGGLTNCCQRIGGVGQSSMVAGYELPESGFVVIEKENTIIAQAWVYEYVNASGKKVFVFDNIETLDVKAYHTQLHELVQGFCAKLADVVDEVHLGLGYNDLPLGVIPVPYNEIQFPASLVRGTDTIHEDDDEDEEVDPRCAAYTDALSRVYLVKNRIVCF